jgi:hypothetical protein
MAVVSIRFAREAVHRDLKRAAGRRGIALSALAERLIDEGLRMEAHPMVAFRDGPGGRRAALAGGPDVADVVGAIVGGNVAVSKRRARAADLMGLSLVQVDAAMAYYAEFTEEIDAELVARAEVAEYEEALWRRQRELLGR